MILQQFPPMGLHETLFQFAEATNTRLGDSRTHPWAQGYPLTSQLPEGPALPESIRVGSSDLKYPGSAGSLALRESIASYYNKYYQAGISAEHVAIFAGGRPAIFATLAFLLSQTEIAIEETECTLYYDALKVLDRPISIVPSNERNEFRPGSSDHETSVFSQPRRFLVKSNPCNPTGVTFGPNEMSSLLRAYSGENRGALIDESYEFFGDPEPFSALSCIEDIDETNFFVMGGASKGLQAPGMRIGWVIASREHIEAFRNYASLVSGGVSCASQVYVTELLESDRVAQARHAVCKYYQDQRARYFDGLSDLGFTLMTGSGGIFHWGAVPDGLSGDDLNDRLFRERAAILPGRLCDMSRRSDGRSSLDHFMRFSFGGLNPASFAEDMAILQRAVG